MRETITTSCGLVLTLPTEEEDVRITEAALADPDARELTDEEWEAVQPFVIRGYRPGGGSST